MKYTLILNYFNKPEHLLERQLDCISKQTLRPEYIYGCFFGLSDKHKSLVSKFKKLTSHWNNTYVVESDFNFRYMGRYQVAIGAPSEYIVILDDDRFPEKGYCESMLNIASQKDCLVGQYGWKLNHDSKKKYKFNMSGKSGYLCGLCDLNGDFIKSNQNLNTNKDQKLLEVDYICGGSTFKRSLLKYLFDGKIFDENGLHPDDIPFSYRCKKHGIPSLVYLPSNQNSTHMLHHDSGGLDFTATNLDAAIYRSQLIKDELGLNEKLIYHIDNEIK